MEALGFYLFDHAFYPHHFGIETIKSRPPISKKRAFTRTILELKFPFDVSVPDEPLTFTRTILELKSAAALPYRTVIEPFNRTILELNYKKSPCFHKTRAFL